MFSLEKCDFMLAALLPTVQLYFKGGRVEKCDQVLAALSTHPPTL